MGIHPYDPSLELRTGPRFSLHLLPENTGLRINPCYGWTSSYSIGAPESFAIYNSVTGRTKLSANSVVSVAASWAQPRRTR